MMENTLSQMEQWSILKNVINHVQYSKVPKNFHDVIIKPININNRINKKIKNENIDECPLRVDLASILGLREEYLDRYEGITSEILNTTRFDENSNFSTAYLGKSNMT